MLLAIIYGKIVIRDNINLEMVIRMDNKEGQLKELEEKIKDLGRSL